MRDFISILFADLPVVMAGWESWIIPLIAFAVFILSSLKKVTDAPKGAKGLPFSPTHSDLDKFLEAARRRNQGAPEKEHTHSKENRDIPYATLVESTPQISRPPLREIPQTPLQVIEDRIRKKKGKQKVKAKQEAAPKVEQFEPTRVVPPQPRPAVLKEAHQPVNPRDPGDFHSPNLKHETDGPATLAKRNINPSIAEAVALLRNGRSLRTMFVLQEILSPPLVNRKGRRH